VVNDESYTFPLKKKKHRRTKKTESKSRIKRESKTLPKRFLGNKVSMTPLWILSGIALAIAGLGGVLYHSKLIALWAAFAGIVLSLAAITIWLHGIIRNESNPATAMPADRPWVSVEVVPAGDITFAADGRATFPFAIKVNNFGRMPANKIGLVAEVICPRGNEFFQAPIKRRDQMCAKGVQYSDFDFGTVFPTKDSEMIIGFDVNAHTIAGQFEPSQKVIWPYFVGCLTYTFSDDGHEFLGQTGFAYEISRSIPNQPGKRVISIGENIPQGEVLISKSTINADFAK
jgi:hypothetical protein